MRAEFEKWYQNEITGCNGEWLEKDEHGEYYEKTTREAWKIWRAATWIMAMPYKAALADLMPILRDWEPDYSTGEERQKWAKAKALLNA